MPRVVAVVESGVRKIVVVDPRLRGIPGEGTGGNDVSTDAAEYRVIAASVPADTLWAMPFAFGNGPGTPLDLTDPENPTVVAGGIYAVTASVSPIGSTYAAGKTMWADLELDAYNDDWLTMETSSLDRTGIAVGPAESPRMSLSLTMPIPAGGVINFYLAHNADVGGGDPLGFTIRVGVQRVGDIGA